MEKYRTKCKLNAGEGKYYDVGEVVELPADDQLVVQGLVEKVVERAAEPVKAATEKKVK